MKERPILFSPRMVQALLRKENPKQQTRRLVNIRHLLLMDETGLNGCLPGNMAQFCPYGQPGDRLWVRETFAYGMSEEEIYYRATDKEISKEEREEGMRWKPSIHMPRRASRITLDIKGIRAERLQDITDEDVVAEGIAAFPGHEKIPRMQFAVRWNSINGERSPWEKNDWVWVVSFERVQDDG